MESIVMKKTRLPLAVKGATEQLKISLTDKGFQIFAEIDHQANAQGVDLDMDASRVLLFGNPQAGTLLMQKDIFMSLDLPLRLALVEKDGETWLLHHDSSDYTGLYQVQGHPVLSKIDALYATLIDELIA
jgi:uncharacterized protein (DUF302 family)